MIFSCVNVKSMDLEFITEITHSKCDFIVGSSPPRLSFSFFLHKIHLGFLLTSFMFTKIIKWEGYQDSLNS